jgi:hypothetical protein
MDDDLLANRIARGDLGEQATLTRRFLSPP